MQIPTPLGLRMAAGLPLPEMILFGTKFAKVEIMEYQEVAALLLFEETIFMTRVISVIFEETIFMPRGISVVFRETIFITWVMSVILRLLAGKTVKPLPKSVFRFGNSAFFAKWVMDAEKEPSPFPVWRVREYQAAASLALWGNQFCDAPHKIGLSL